MVNKRRNVEPAFELPWWAPKTLQEEDLEHQKHLAAREAAHDAYKTTHPDIAITIPTPTLTKSATTPGFLEIRHAVEASTYTDYTSTRSYPDHNNEVGSVTGNDRAAEQQAVGLFLGEAEELEERSEKVFACGMPNKLFLFVWGVVLCMLITGIMPTVYLALQKTGAGAVDGQVTAVNMTTVMASTTIAPVSTFHLAIMDGGSREWPGVGTRCLQVRQNMDGRDDGNISRICKKGLDLHLSINYDEKRKKYKADLGLWGLKPVDLIFPPDSSGLIRAVWITTKAGASKCDLVEMLELLIDENSSQVVVEQKLRMVHDCPGFSSMEQSSDLGKYGCSWRGVNWVQA